MNIKHYLSAVAALGLLAACSEYDPGMSDQAIDLTDAEIETIEEYRANFIARYGEPAEGHTWGFGAKGSEDEMGTRTIEAHPEKNQWYYTQSDWDYVKMAEYLTGNGFNSIPGYPYEIQATDSKYSGKYMTQQTDGGNYTLLSEPQNNYNPAGDVTDEEMKYVAMWFRSHRLEDNDFYAENFFIQDVSGDMDYTKYPQWNDIKDHLDEPLDEQYRQVRTAINKSDNSVYSNTDIYELDYLKVTETVNPTFDGGTGWTHILNFNNGATTWRPYQNGTFVSNSQRTITFITSDGCDAISCRSSSQNVGDAQVTEETWQRHYHLEHLSFTINGRHYEGDYLGFDIEIDDQQKKLERDHYYNNWILKVNGVQQIQNHKWNRIMCEDLGATDDYDFNDLVYDVYFTGTNNQYTAHIKVLASGGTLPIYVGTHTENLAREAHQILQGGNAKKLNGGQLYQPVNVSAGVTANPVEFEFEMKDASGNWLTGDAGTDPDNIPILVTSTDKSRQTASGKNTFVLLKAEKNPVPQKICIDGNLIDATKVRWMKERKQIESTYTLFDHWATAGDKDNSEYHFGKTSDWTNHGLENTGNLQ